MDDKFLEVAKKAALEAGKLIQSFLGKKHTEKAKRNSSDFATEADLSAENLIIQIISEDFPDHNIISEEREADNKGSEYTWVIDPLDGTTAFSTGMPIYSVSIGLLYKHTPIVGVVNQSGLGDLYWAVKGQGAFLNGTRILVSSTPDLEHAVINFDSGHIGTREEKFEKYLYPLMGKIRYVYSLGGGVMATVLVAKGTLDAAPNTAYIWDVAAAAIILTEAGGKITDLEGKKPDWNQKRFDWVASNGLIHEQILEALR